jgi:hypothetical protein
MVASRTEPKKLDLAMDLKDSRYFLDTTLTKNLVKVLHVVEELTVRGKQYFSLEYRPEEDSFASTLSTSIPCPRLRSLTVEPPSPNRHPEGGIMRLLRWLGVPDPKHITIVEGCSQDRDTIAFLLLFKGSQVCHFAWYGRHKLRANSEILAAPRARYLHH